MDRVDGDEVGASLTLLETSNGNISKDIAVVDVVVCENRYGLLCACGSPFINLSLGRKRKVTQNCTISDLLWNEGVFDDAVILGCLDVILTNGGIFTVSDERSSEGEEFFKVLGFLDTVIHSGLGRELNTDARGLGGGEEGVGSG